MKCVSTRDSMVYRNWKLFKRNYFSPGCCVSNQCCTHWWWWREMRPEGFSHSETLITSGISHYAKWGGKIYDFFLEPCIVFLHSWNRDLSFYSQFNLFLYFTGSVSMYTQKMTTLESGINVAPWINLAPGKFGKKNKHSPIYTLYLYYLNRLYEVWNKAVAPGKKSKN